MTNIADKKLAKRLAIIVMESGDSAVSEIKPALEKLLSGRSNLDKRRFLAEFKHALKREVHKDTLFVEAPGGPSDELISELTAHFQKTHSRKLQLRTADNPSLIGGVRVRLGDSVYDASVSAKLAALAANIH